MEKLTPQEEEAMQIIWQKGEVTVKMILQEMEAPKPPYTTLASTVKNLEKKGFVTSYTMANTNMYKPKVEEELYKKKYMQAFIENYFDNSYKALVTFFAKQKKLSANELKEVIELIEKGNKS